MKRAIITTLMVIGSVIMASAQKNYYKPDKSKMTQEQRMVQSNAKHKDGGRNADVSKKVQRAKRQDRASKRMKAPKNRVKRKK